MDALPSSLDSLPSGAMAHLASALALLGVPQGDLLPSNATLPPEAERGGSFNPPLLPDDPAYRWSLLANLTRLNPYLNVTNLNDTFLSFLLDDFNATSASPPLGDNTVLYDVPTGIVVLLSLFYGSISLVAVVGNALVMWIVATSRKMHSVTNYFIANLALADIIIGLFSIPFQFQAALLQRWNLPHFMCAFCPFFQTVSVNVSIFTLTAIAVDRYRAIVHPLSARPSKFRSKVVIVSIWLFSTTLAIPNAIALRVTTVQDTATGKSKPYCYPVNIDKTIMWTYSHMMVALQYFLPLCIISFAYLRMGWELWGSQTPGNAEDARDAHVLKNKKKVIKMLFMVVALFAVCWAPLQTYHVMNELYPDINRYRFINIIWFCCHWLAMSNSCYNPFIYAIYNEKFKREFRLRFRCCFREVRSTELSDIERSRYQVSYRSTHSTVVRTMSTASHSRGNGNPPLDGPLQGGLQGGPHHQEVHVCVPLKAHSHLHPEIYRSPRLSVDTRM